ncbi:hypothetical protein D0T49_12110 [Paludibacter sp. 221]|uniref:major capsid protein n=1 Tax=Paludibacter sp. 221 TaxID=2302939 RepID=UPI0013D5F24D|nr:major capsid protein [Paludibacter sp. 221]NDV47790.1 hypothetical protein [Paludibacter sp. 221]
MEQSLYPQYVQRYMPQLVSSIVDKLNTNDETEVCNYLYQMLLARTYSVDGKWESLIGEHGRVAADVVAMDSSLPLKKRQAIRKATGDIPKIGMELYLNEKQLTDLDTMIALNMDEEQIAAKLFEDMPRVIAGVYERLEMMFLQGLSTGVALTSDDNNVGTGVRIDYGFSESNKLGVEVSWKDNPTTATPLDDINRVLAKAREDGNVLNVAYTDSATINALLATKQVRDLYAFIAGYPGENVPVPTLEQANTAIRAKYKFTIQEIDRTVKVEKNGKQTNINPWQEGIMTFAPAGQLGQIAWTRLAEMSHPVAGASYSTADDYILVSKYRVNRPSLREYTSSQARVIPVITNVDRLYQLDTKKVQE